MDNPITHEIEKAEALRAKVAKRLNIVTKEAIADKFFSPEERLGVVRIREKLAELDRKIAALKKRRDAGEGVPDPAQAEEASFSDSDFEQAFLQSVINWTNDARSAVNVLSDLSGMDPKKAKIEVKDVMGILDIFPQTKAVASAFDIATKVKDFYEKALQQVASAGTVTLIDVRMGWEKSIDDTRSQVRTAQYRMFVDDYKKKNKVTGDTIDKRVFRPECFHFGTNYLPSADAIKKEFAKQAVNTLYDQDWGEAAEMERGDGKKAGYIIVKLDGKAQYVGVPQEHGPVAWGGSSATIDEAGDGIKAAVASAYGDTALLDMPFRISLQIDIDYGNGGARRAQFFRTSETPGSTAFAVREDIVTSSFAIGAGPRKVPSAKSMELLRAAISGSGLKAMTGKRIYK